MHAWTRRQVSLTLSQTHISKHSSRSSISEYCSLQEVRLRGLLTDPLFSRARNGLTNSQKRYALPRPWFVFIHQHIFGVNIVERRCRSSLNGGEFTSTPTPERNPPIS